MRYAVNSELAEADLADIWVEIATDDIDTADRFIQGLRTLAQKLAEQPFMGRVRPDLGQDVRVFPHEQHLIIYRPAARRPTNDAPLAQRAVSYGRHRLELLECR